MLAKKLGGSVDDVEDLVIWGNHSPTMFPDLFNAKFKGEQAAGQVDMDWYENEYMPKVGKRGAAIIEARGASSAASAANAAIDHMRDWVQGADGLRSMAVPSGGQYGVEEGIISSFPVRTTGGSYEIVEGLEVGEFAQAKIDITVDELKGERDAVTRARPDLDADSTRTPSSSEHLSPYSGLNCSLDGQGRLGGVLGVPAAALLGDEAVLGEARQHAVEVVLLDLHRLGELGDGDAGLLAHERQRLLGARAGAARAPALAGARRRAGGPAAALAPGRRGGARRRSRRRR